MDSLEGFSPEDTSGFIAIQGEFLVCLIAERTLTEPFQPSASRSTVFRSRRMASPFPSKALVVGSWATGINA